MKAQAFSCLIVSDSYLNFLADLVPFILDHTLLLVEESILLYPLLFHYKEMTWSDQITSLHIAIIPTVHPMRYQILDSLLYGRTFEMPFRCYFCKWMTLGHNLFMFGQLENKIWWI